MISSSFLSPRQVFAIPMIVGFSLVGVGVVVAQELNLAACPLCIIQRMLYLLISALAACGILLPQVGRLMVAVLMATASAAGIFVAGYQVWLQRFAVGVSCSANQPWWERVVDRAGDLVPWLFQGNGMCSDRSWLFLSLSIADWSLLIFCGLLVFSIYAMARQRR